MRSFPRMLGLFLGAAALTAQAAPAPAPTAPNLPALQRSLERMAGELRLDGVGLAVVRDSDVLHLGHHGALRPGDVIPIASASKWLAVAAILTLVDEGKLDLDVPVGRYLKEFDRVDKQTVTLRMCLANTSGLPARLTERMGGWDMQRFVQAAAEVGLRDWPSMRFLYGGVGFQVAAAAAERVSGQNWHELFAARIAGPLGMADTKFGTLLPVGGEAGTAKLPWVAGGAVASLDDYTRFLRMLVGKGRFGERRILQEASVEAMMRDQVVAQVDVRAVGFEAKDVRYGLGTWLEPLGQGAWRASDPGAFGFTPWLDLDLGIGGVLAVRDRVGRVLPALRVIQDDVRKLARSPVVAGTDIHVTLSHGGFERRYQLHLPGQTAPGAGLPLVLVLHGGGGHGEQVREQTGFAELADREGFAVAFPDGTGPARQRLLTWNSGGIQVWAAENRVDDTGFLRKVVADVQRQARIDPARVFAVGISNGGMMCHRLAREAADVFAGIGVVSGAMNFTAGDSALPIAAILIHGTADGHVRYDGGTPLESVGRTGERVDASVADAVRYYQQRNGLLGYPQQEIDGKVRIDTYAKGREGKPAAAPLRVVTLEGGGHAWPGAAGKSRPAADKPFPFDATRALWQFFAGITRPVAPAAPAAPAPPAESKG